MKTKQTTTFKRDFEMRYGVSPDTKPVQQGKPQHSDLPWRIMENYKGSIPLSIQSDENTTVARVDWLPNGSGRPGEKNIANAALIVRAVNAMPAAEAMAEALKKLSDAMDRGLNLTDPIYRAIDSLNAWKEQQQ